MAAPAPKTDATLADLDALPAHMKGEIIDGVLYAMTRPRGVHQSVAGRVHADIEPAYERGRGGPGGWWILPEPGVELARAKEISPDVAGWRRARLPSLPRDAAITVVPDWVCEVLSPTIRRHHNLVKRPLYAAVGVQWLWTVDSEALTVTVHRLQDGRWLELGVYADERDARIEPFADIAVDVSAWWPEAVTPG